jgi:hypothetical protein
MSTVSPTSALIRSLGWWGGLRVGLRLALGAGGDPFGHLTAPKDERERLSRAQAVLAIRLYRTLLERYSPERSLVVAGHVIEAGAVQHLGKTLGDLDVRAFASLQPAERHSKVQGWIASFFTATARIDDVRDDHVSFTVTACALARLCAEAGHPELAPAFCRGDALFFAAQDPPVELERPHTLAEGAHDCPFRLKLR